MDLRQVFATNLRKARQSAGMSQDELAFRADVNRQYVSKIETGSTWVGLEIIGRLSKVLRVSPASLLTPPGRRLR
jgi:transcriptional regulator with XRE-family HTH domain